MADGSKSLRDRQAVLQYDFKRTEKELNELDISLELWIKQIITSLKIIDNCAGDITFGAVI